MINFVAFSESYKYQKKGSVSFLIEPNLHSGSSPSGVQILTDLYLPSSILKFCEDNKLNQRCLDMVDSVIEESAKIDRVVAGLHKVIFYSLIYTDVNLIYFSKDFYPMWANVLHSLLDKKDVQSVVR